LIELGANKTHAGRQSLNYLGISVPQTPLLLVFRLVLALATDFPDLLQEKSGGGDDLASLGEIEADEEVKTRVFFAEHFEERSQLCTAQLVKVHQLLAVQAHSRRPVLDEHVGLGIRVEVIAELLYDCRLACLDG
jgi:hypothetical protein